jgi:hypothetical protein
MAPMAPGAVLVVTVEMTASFVTSAASRLSPQELRQRLLGQLDRWANYPQGAKPAGWLDKTWHAPVDSNALHGVCELILNVLADDTRDRARSAVEPLVARGLVRRAGRCLDHNGGDVSAWRIVAGVYRELGGDLRDLRCEFGGRRFPLLVCASCTQVFQPKRKVRATHKGTQTRYCELCSKRSQPPDALGPSLALPRLANLDEHESLTVRRPYLDGRFIKSWGVTTITRCTECREPMHGRADKRVCAKACESRCQRRVDG